SVASQSEPTRTAKETKNSKQESGTVLPRDLKVRVTNERLIDIRRELIKLKRKDFPNAGAVLLRVFFEVAVIDYLERCGELSGIIARIETKEGRKLPFGVPTLKQLVPEITRIARKHLAASEAIKVEKAVRYDPSA